MAQLSFSFPQNENYLEEDFVILPENSSAKFFLDKFFAQKDFSTATLPSLILKGEEASGKTNLLHIYAKKSGAQFVNCEKNPANFFVQNQFYILDDADEIKDDETLLHLINSAVEAKAFLVLAMQNISKFKLRDLVSRLKNIAVAEIKNPSLDSIEQLLANGFARRQIKVSLAEIKSISKKIPRTYRAISDAINAA